MVWQGVSPPDRQSIGRPTSQLPESSKKHLVRNQNTGFSKSSLEAVAQACGHMQSVFVSQSDPVCCTSLECEEIVGKVKLTVRKISGAVLHTV